MTECNHYDCKHFRAFDDGIGVDTYCKYHKEWFWCDGETPICEHFEEEEQ